MIERLWNWTVRPRYEKYPYRCDLRQKARALRKAGTLGEVLLWCALRGKRLGHTFRRQVPVGNYIVDFLCHEKRLAVEIDGGTHDHEEQYSYDQERQAWLESKGVRVIRFAEREVRENLDGVVERLRQVVNGEE